MWMPFKFHLWLLYFIVSCICTLFVCVPLYGVFSFSTMWCVFVFVLIIVCRWSSHGVFKFRVFFVYSIIFNKRACVYTAAIQTDFLFLFAKIPFFREILRTVLFGGRRYWTQWSNSMHTPTLWNCRDKQFCWYMEREVIMYMVTTSTTTSYDESNLLEEFVLVLFVHSI